jgi:hypothetical protein
MCGPRLLVDRLSWTPSGPLLKYSAVFSLRTPLESSVVLKEHASTGDAAGVSVSYGSAFECKGC